VKEKQFVDSWKIPGEDHVEESKQVAHEVLDGLVKDLFNFRILEKQSEMKLVTKVKPDLATAINYQEQRKSVPNAPRGDWSSAVNVSNQKSN